MQVKIWTLWNLVRDDVCDDSCDITIDTGGARAGAGADGMEAGKNAEEGDW